MTARRRSFLRKIIYGTAILPLLFVLHWLGSPSTLDTETAKGSRGGVLAQQREKDKLAQVYYGKIDPTSETLKLVTLGMRGIAADILWIKGIEYQKKKDWTNLSATLNQIIKLEPNFIDVWRHQGWNLSYNCSAEFDDYRERYRWVIKGIDFLDLGTTYNEREPRLLRDIGWFIAQKIGRSDEHRQFRRLFAADEPFHKRIGKHVRIREGLGPDGKPDNWLVGKLWFRKAEELIDSGGVSPRGMNPLIFRSQAAMCQMNCAAALEQDGVFGDVAQWQWQQASKDWDAFGQFAIATSKDWAVRLGQFDQLKKNRQKVLDRLDALAPGVREKLYKSKLVSLTDEQRKARATPGPKRTSEQHMLAAKAEALLEVRPYEIARNRDMPRENRPKAKELLEEIVKLDDRIGITKSYRGVVNYDYWDQRAKIEQRKEMITARKLVYEGGEELAKGNLSSAASAFADGSRAWYRMLREYPMLMTDKATIDDIDELLEQYGRALDQDDKLFPYDPDDLDNPRNPRNFALAQFVRAQVKDSNKMHRIRLNRKKAEEAEAAGDLATASTFYEKELHNWRGLIADLPSLEQMSDRVTGELILAAIRKYAEVLTKLNQAIPDDFVLHRFVRVQMEHDPETHRAQIAMEAAQAAMEAAQTASEKGQSASQKEHLAAARKAYEQGFALWRSVLERYPTLVADSTLGEELLVVIDEYRQLLDQQQAQMPKDFVLQDILDRYDQP